jgi:VanZ family protein
VLKAKKFGIAFFGWMFFVTWASLSTFPDDGTPDIDIPHFDKLVHFCFYFGAAVLGTLFVRESFHKRAPLMQTLMYVILGAVAFGILIEVLQYNFTANREGDFYDALANTFGAIIGAWAMKLLFSDKRGLKWR